MRDLILVMALGLASGCMPWRQPPPLPVASSVALEQLVVYSDFSVPRQHRLLQELDALRGHMVGELALAVSDEPVHVYLFKTPRRYKAFMREHYPDFPDRRALFVETDTRLSVYAYWGDQIVEDLRHEVAHGYLHAVVPNLPLWLDEGLAEYFEVNADALGVNQNHVDQLQAAIREGTWRPDLARLQQLATVADMDQIHYAEAWAWVHFLLRTTPQRRQLLQDYVARLHAREAVEPLSSEIMRVEPDAAGLLIAHLRELRDPAAVSLP